MISPMIVDRAVSCPIVAYSNSWMESISFRALKKSVCRTPGSPSRIECWSQYLFANAQAQVH